MAKILLFLIIFFVAVIVIAVAYDKIIHPLLFKEELDETLENAVEEKVRKEVNKKAQEILEDKDANR